MPNNSAAVGLMSSQDKNLSYLDVGGSAHGKINGLGNVLTRQGLDALIDVIGTLLITMETDDREVGLDQTWLDIGHTHAGMRHPLAFTVCI